MVELYNELRSTIDSCAEERRKAVEWEKEQEEADVKNNEFGIAVVGLPNVVKFFSHAKMRMPCIRLPSHSINLSFADEGSRTAMTPQSSLVNHNSREGAVNCCVVCQVH